MPMAHKTSKLPMSHPGERGESLKVYEAFPLVGLLPNSLKILNRKPSNVFSIVSNIFQS